MAPSLSTMTIASGADSRSPRNSESPPVTSESKCFMPKRAPGPRWQKEEPTNRLSGDRRNVVATDRGSCQIERAAAWLPDDLVQMTIEDEEVDCSANLLALHVWKALRVG